jgi:hypothetical protein
MPINATATTRPAGEGLVEQRAHSDLPPELERLAVCAESLFHDPTLNAAFEDAVRDPGLWSKAQANPWGFLEDRGLTIPEGLAVSFVRPDGIGKPVPDYPFFAFRLSRCRTYWLREPDGTGVEEVEVCWGFEIVPHPLPPIA